MSPQMKKMLTYTCITFGIIFGIYVIKKGIFTYFMSHYEMPPVTISEITATPTVWQNYLNSIGTLTAANGTDISAEASGIVKEIHFESGQAVNKGDILVLLDTAIEEAQLKNDMAQLALAQINFDRASILIKKKVISQAEYDTTSAKLDEVKANVQATEARINQKTIRAPFSGKLGIRQINIGQFISAGTAMVTLQDLTTLRVQFSVPEKYVTELYTQQAITISVDANTPNNHIYSGTITAINSKINPETRNILVEATIPNTSLQLYPGMFAEVKIILKSQENVITLPQTAISYSLHGDSVFIIKSDDKNKEKNGQPVLHAYRQYVKVGQRHDDKVVILEGLKPNDRVVTSGQLKLQNGTHILIDNTVEL